MVSAKKPGKSPKRSAAGRAERSERSKLRAIVRAAVKVFLEFGYRGANMDRIAEEAVVSKRTVYTYFASKEEMFSAVLSELFRGFSDLPPAAVGRRDEPQAVLGSLGRRILEFLLSKNVLAAHRVVSGLEADRFPEMGALYFDHGPRTLARRVADEIAALERAGWLGVPSPLAAAWQFIGMLLTPIHLRATFGGRYKPSRREIDRLVNDTVAMFLRSYARRKSARTRARR